MIGSVECFFRHFSVLFFVFAVFVVVVCIGTCLLCSDTKYRSKIVRPFKRVEMCVRVRI